MKLRTSIFGCALASMTLQAHAVNQDIQIASVSLDGGVVELLNFGDDPIAMDGWRFCTQSTTQVRVYTGSAGFNGTTLGADESLFIHLDNDAPATAGHINVSSLGGAFATLDLEAYAISFYFPNKSGFVSFGDPALMVDHIQFSRNGLNNFTADERTDEAVAAGLWTALTDWISINDDSSMVQLTDTSGGLLHGPSDYNVLGAPCAPDFTGDGILDIFDVFDFIAAFNAMDPSADFAADGIFDIFDVFGFVDAYNTGCP